MDNDSNVATPQDDGAGEKLVDEKNGHNSKGIEVKYVTPTSQNGDAKIDIENLKSAFAGMGKEELMKFANDPFWVRTRWFLFVLFWLLWIAMLAGAIAIIVLAPKCAPPTPKEWWEQSPLYKADVGTFTKDTNKLKGFTTKLDYLKNLGVQTVVLSNILKVSDKNSDGKEDEFKTIAPSFGTLDDFKALISAAKDKGLKILLTLVPNHSSLKNEFFRKSAENDTQYSSYYVWATGKGFDNDNKPLPPNNWLQYGKEKGPAWEWHEGKKAFYLHQFDKDEPDFNFHNPQVVNYFTGVMKYWLDLGVSGFYLERTPYLLEAGNLADEKQERSITDDNYLGNYGFFSHDQTTNLPELVPLLQGWKSFVANSSGILVVDSVTLDRSVAKGTKVADLVVQPKPQTLPAYPALSADDLKNLVYSTLGVNSWPVWQMKVEKEDEGSDLSKGLLLCSMLLPGVPVTVAGQELGLKNLKLVMPWDNSTGIEGTDVKSQQNNKHSMYSAYHKLVEARKSASILYGEHTLHVFNSTSVFAYTRIKSGNPGYLVVFNLGESETVVDVRQMDRVPDDLTLILTSDESQMANLTKVESDSVSLPSRAVAVFSIVPK